MSRSHIKKIKRVRANRNRIFVPEGEQRPHPDTGDILTLVSGSHGSLEDPSYWWESRSGERFLPFDDDAEYVDVLDPTRTIAE